MKSSGVNKMNKHGKAKTEILKFKKGVGITIKRKEISSIYHKAQP